MSYDGVHIDPAVAAAGVQSWQATAESLQREVRERIAAIEAAHGRAPWGEDHAGGEFSAAYMKSAPSVAQYVPEGADRLAQLGDNVELAVQRSLDSDAEQAAAVTIPVESGL